MAVSWRRIDPWRPLKTVTITLTAFFFLQMKSEFISSKTETPLLLITVNSWDLLLLKHFYYLPSFGNGSSTYNAHWKTAQWQHTQSVVLQGLCAGLFPGLDVFTVPVTNKHSSVVIEVDWRELSYLCIQRILTALHSVQNLINNTKYTVIIRLYWS